MDEKIKLWEELCGFVPIASNLYEAKLEHEFRKKFFKREDLKCTCKNKTGKCASGCINQDLFYECPSSCGRFCENRFLQKNKLNQNHQISYFATKNKGYGVLALEDIDQGKLIIEYVGLIQRSKEYKAGPNFFSMKLNNEYVINAERYGNISRHINHSCVGNCDVEKWYVDGLPRIVFRTNRAIKRGEEITYNYQFTAINPKSLLRCFCGEEQCRQFIGVNKPFRTFECRFCKKSFHRKDNLKKHQTTHDKRTPYECKTCWKSFTDPTNLKRHINSVHTKIKKFYCPFCEKIFFRSDKFKNHKIKTHARK